MLSRFRVLEISFSVLLVGLILRIRRQQAKPHLPPGPKGLPIIGNALDIPLQNMTQTYYSWTKKYGMILKSDVIYLEAGGKKIVILNSYDAATDLLDKKSHVYSSRPQTTMLCELMDLWWLFAIMPYSEAWKERRRTFVQHFPMSNPSIHQPKEIEFIHSRLLPQLLKSPEGFMDHIRHVIGGILISLAYGIPTKPENDPFIHLAEESMLVSANAAIPGKFLVDVFSFLKYIPEWVPGAGFQRQAKEWKELWRRFKNTMFDAAEENIARGNAQHSFVSSCLEAVNERADLEKQKLIIKETAITFLAAGADTLGATIVVFILAMVLNPDVQAKAQAELDRVLENGRLPELSDQDSLPYLTALMKEVVRWQPANPQGELYPCLLLSTEDDTYSGYHIPKDSIVIPNLWAMSRDERRYPDPEAFKPERYLTPDGKLDPNASDPFDFAFGFGRRKCVGPHIAISTLWIAIASILATFKISKHKDELGNSVDPVVDFKSANIVASQLCASLDVVVLVSLGDKFPDSFELSSVLAPENCSQGIHRVAVPEARGLDELQSDWRQINHRYYWSGPAIDPITYPVASIERFALVIVLTNTKLKLSLSKAPTRSSALRPIEKANVGELVSTISAQTDKTRNSSTLGLQLLIFNNILDYALREHLTEVKERAHALTLLSRTVAAKRIYPERLMVTPLQYHSRPKASGGFGALHQGIDPTPGLSSQPFTAISTLDMALFSKAQNFEISGGNWTDNSVRNELVTYIQGRLNGKVAILLNFDKPQFSSHQNPLSGIDVLLEASEPGAAHNSVARTLAPRCHPGTRERFIQELTRWAVALSEYHPFVWMKGPAGVDKSAIAQSCVEQLSAESIPYVAYFFSINGRSDPRRLFPSIAYQLSLLIPEYHAFLEEKISCDKTLLTRSLRGQLHGLIVEPLRELQKMHINTVSRRIPVFVDGLDECEYHRAQCDIAEAVAEVLRLGVLPLRFAIFSRPEAHLETAFSQSDSTGDFMQIISLQISRDDDKEIERFLRAGFQEILGRRNMPMGYAWPSDKEIFDLVDAADGLFKITRLDVLYLLIMRNISLGRLPVSGLLLTLLCLEATSFNWKGSSLLLNSNFLGLSEFQYRAVCGDLSSVLYIKEQPPIELPKGVDPTRSFLENDQKHAQDISFLVQKFMINSMRRAIQTLLCQPRPDLQETSYHSLTTTSLSFFVLALTLKDFHAVLTEIMPMIPPSREPMTRFAKRNFETIFHLRRYIYKGISEHLAFLQWKYVVEVQWIGRVELLALHHPEFSKFNILQFKKMVQDQLWGGLISECPPPSFSLPINIDRRNCESGLFTVGADDGKSVFWYWEIDFDQRVYREFYAPNLEEGMLVFRHKHYSKPQSS
ncbi:hypothetical protein NP233_g8820 [Leucocoprinus birnbaumii]|uniref:Nephrocystin 3-like N-terminal domain-containing protein n=1 Tax=Leucocoprinus birnbaumii TaxID=56174 RepID=A0AAD5VLR0_9AGAR|nr:hypothetical protein NP233_g8820 [Leucocoprinus birnbaumii]